MPNPTKTAPTPNNQIREKVEQVLEPVTLPKPQRGQVVESVTRLIAERFVGPLPHPKHLAEYEACSPGLAMRIAGMAEYAQRKSEERMDLAVSREFDERSLGLKLGFKALCAVLLAGTVIVLAGYELIGVGLLGVAVLSGVVGLFVHGRSILRPNPPEALSKKSQEPKAPQAP